MSETLEVQDDWFCPLCKRITPHRLLFRIVAGGLPLRELRRFLLERVCLKCRKSGRRSARSQ